MPSFEVTARDTLARNGILRTCHGTARTPALLPVIHPGQMTIPPSDLRRIFGADIIITNSYIIRGRAEFSQRAVREGVHGLVGFDGPVMTDSGTFQNYVYGDVEVTQKEILDFQKSIGSDLCTMLDVFSTPGTPVEKATGELEENNRRAIEASGHFHSLKTESGLVLTVQGSVYPHLRQQSARQTAKLECAVQAIGGVVPLMESYRFAELVEVVLSSRRYLDPSKPVHLFGAGHPMMFALGALMGCDMFDSASYAKYAKDGRMMFPDGTKSLADLEHLPCACPVCSAFSAGELKKKKDEERMRLLAEHNLHVSFAELRAVRQAIEEGTLWELVEERCRAHPSLLDALAALGRHAHYLERFAPASRRGAFFYKGHSSSQRPEVLRWGERITQRYRMPECELMICLPEAPRPYSRHYHDLVTRVLEKYDARFVVESFFGPVPLELDGMWPIAQSLVPATLDSASVDRIKGAMKEFSHRLKSPLSLVWDGPQSFGALEMMVLPRAHTLNWDALVVGSTADIQFGAGAADALLKGKIEFVRSPNTGRVRNVIADGKHILSLRATDGLLSLKLAGAERLRAAFSPPRLRVVVDPDAAQFAVLGKNVFAKFVEDCDPELRPMDETIVVDEKDNLVAVGRALMVKEEMHSFKRGIAVKIREGLGHPGEDDGE